MSILARWRERRAERTADARAARYEEIDADIADARAAATRTDYALAITPGVYVEPSGGYVYSSSYLLRLAERCRHVDTAQVESLLWIAAQQAQDAQGVPPLVVPLRECDEVPQDSALRLVGVA